MSIQENMDIPKIPELKAIETKYKGYTFRSRLEARWAVFMDNLGISYQYECEGYDLDGLWYLPDFWLPTFDGGCFMEVKPIPLNKLEFEKAKRLCLASNKKVILAIGPPDFICQEFLYPENCGGVINIDKSYGLMNADQAYDENRFFGLPGYEEADLTIDKRNYDCLGEMFVGAVYASREARF